MYDFCLTLPWATVLALGGVLGFVTKGSLPSLLGGLGSAAVLAVCGQVSLSAYHKGKLCKPATAVSLLVSVALAAMMAVRWRRTGKFMPPGMVAVLSTAMVVFYVWNLLHFKEPLHRPAAHKA